MSHTHTYIHTYIHVYVCVWERERERVQEEEYLHENFNKEKMFLQGMKWRAHFGRSMKNCWMRINFVNHGFKRASIKKIVSTTKTKDQDHVELYDISCTKLSSNSRWSSPLFRAEIDEQIKRMNLIIQQFFMDVILPFQIQK
jgi:hypothetical protein